MSSRLKTVFVLLLVGISVSQSPKAQAQSAQIDTYIRGWMERRHIPGVSLVVIKDKRIVKSSQYGLANVELNVPVNERTSFEIASMTKQFTAAALLLLVEEGKVSLDAPITKYFDNVPNSWAEIRIRQLMDHTSGLRDDWDENNDFFLTKNSNEEFLNALKRSPLLFKTGERYGYSCGPFLVGMIIERVSGMPYARFMQERIFKPLGMVSTHVNDPWILVPDRASGYVYREGKLMNGARISPAAHARGDVGIRTTALDLAKWDAAMNDTRLLTRASLSTMFAPARVNDGSQTLSGLGWWLNPIRGRPAATHGGAFRTGFNSTINRYLDDDLTVIILANRFRVAANETGHVIAGFYNAAFRSISSMPITADRRPERTAELKDVLLSLAGGSTKLGALGERFPYRAYEPNDWEQLVKGMKTISFINCEGIPRRGSSTPGEKVHEICFFKIEAGDEDRYVSATMGVNGKIVYIEPYEY